MNLEISTKAYKYDIHPIRIIYNSTKLPVAVMDPSLGFPSLPSSLGFPTPVTELGVEEVRGSRAEANGGGGGGRGGEGE